MGKKHKHTWSFWEDSQSPGFELRFTRCGPHGCARTQCRRKTKKKKGVK